MRTGTEVSFAARLTSSATLISLLEQPIPKGRQPWLGGALGPLVDTSALNGFL